MPDDDEFMYDDEDYCYECSGLGDDYYINDEGELENWCPHCSINPHNRHTEEE